MDELSLMPSVREGWQYGIRYACCEPVTAAYSNGLCGTLHTHNKRDEELSSQKRLLRR